jgi:hypothetical protein
VREGHSDFGPCFHTSFESLHAPGAGGTQAENRPTRLTGDRKLASDSHYRRPRSLAAADRQAPDPRVKQVGSWTSGVRNSRKFGSDVSKVVLSHIHWVSGRAYRPPPFWRAGRSSLGPSPCPYSPKCSQAILGPLLGVIQDMYLNDSHKGKEGFTEVCARTVPSRTRVFHRQPVRGQGSVGSWAATKPRSSWFSRSGNSIGSECVASGQFLIRRSLTLSRATRVAAAESCMELSAAIAT